jgi:MATE family multidrug resistance protein
VAVIVAGLLLGTPRLLLGLFTDDGGVVTLGLTLLAICAAFQPFDGVQVVATGALRGLGDTTTPMVLNLIGHWVVGLPLGYVLCFSNQWGVTGLWVGLAIGLTVVGVAMIVTWFRRSATGGLAVQGATG